MCLNAGAARRNDIESETFVASTLNGSGAGGSRPGGQANEHGFLTQTRRGVRRLTPTEWERLMGMPDGYTAIPYRGKPAKDAPRYRAIGNSFAVPVMRWIGERISNAE